MARVLIVEDSPTQAQELQLTLEPAGHEVSLARDAEEGIRLLESGEFDLVVSDIVMPGMTGYDFCRRVKAERKWRDVPVILLTTLSDPMDIVQGLESGADNFITKPYDPEYLLARIRNILDTRRMRSEGKLRMGVEIFFLGKKFTITSEREQILDLLIATFEDIVRMNQQLQVKQAKLTAVADVLRALTRVASDLNRAETEEEVIGRTLERAMEIPGVRGGWVSLLERGGGFRLAGFRGLPPALSGPGALEGDCACRRMLLSGELGEAVNVVECDRLRAASGDTGGLRCHASIPLWGGGERLGVLNLAGPGQGTFGEEELRVLHGLGNQVGVALERTALLGRLEERAQLSEDKYRTLTANAGDAIFVLDGSGIVVEANLQAEALLGCPRESILGRVYLEFLVPEERLPAEERHERLKSEGRLRSTDVRMRQAAGGEVICDVTLSLVAHKKESFTFAIVRDVTDRKRLERQFHQAQKMEAIGRLAGGVAHDFNNLLTVIGGYTDLLLGKVRDDPQLGPQLEEVRKAAERAGALTHQLLAFGRKQIIMPRMLELNGVVAELGKLLRRLIGEDIEMKTVLEPNLGRVRADPTQVEQILMNLSINARDAMPGGGKLTIETTNVQIEEEDIPRHLGLRSGSYVCLAITDTGTGMDEETQSHIFEPFFTTKEEGKGTGLGLATVYGIVKQNGGGIYVYSEPGRGTCFKVYLPRADGPEEHEERRKTAGDVRGGAETVLVVEDNDSVRTLACSVLRSFGYHVFEARLPAEAISLCEKEGMSIDLLVTDVVMPGMSGRTLAQGLAPLYPRMKVLYTSGYTDNAIVHHGVLEQGLSFLQKPFSPQVLAARVREMLDSGGSGTGT